MASVPSTGVEVTSLNIIADPPTARLRAHGALPAAVVIWFADVFTAVFPDVLAAAFATVLAAVKAKVPATVKVTVKVKINITLKVRLKADLFIGRYGNTFLRTA